MQPRSILITLIVVCIVHRANMPLPPPDSIGPYINGIFSDQIPGEDGTWSIEEVYDWIDAPSPLRLLALPDTEDYLLLTKVGLVYRINFEDQTLWPVLDIFDQTFNLSEGGSVGFALHPQFETLDGSNAGAQCLFLFYRYKPNASEWSDLGYNRLSKFTWDVDQQRFLEESEEILIQQFDRSVWHNGGGMFFGQDGYLYLALGDEGADEHQIQSTQTITGGLFSGLIRIDVDNDPATSHPIRRQPQHFGNPPEGWEGSYTQGYSIPNDNPWLDEGGGILEEFYAIGLRSPYSTHLDTLTNRIWCADVGSDKREEINYIQKGDNLQWPYKEGSIASETHNKPANLIGTEKTPFYEYDREVGSAIIGGGVYRGPDFPNLYGQYVFADYVYNKLFALDFSEVSLPERRTLISNLGNLSNDLPEEPGIASVFLLENGKILISAVSSVDFTRPGKIVGLTQQTSVPDPPRFLSELGVFTDLQNLQPISGIIPYGVNSPLWSDGAIKKRWIAIPDGQQIKFKSSDPWEFPEGTVFIKHFELPNNLDETESSVRLETRFFVLAKGGKAYGLTYQWNEDGTDAELLTIGKSKEVDILDQNGTILERQTWDFPSRDQCLSCHNSNAQYVLGVNTHQLNGMYDYQDGTYNQIQYWASEGILDLPTGINIDMLPKSYPIDDTSVDLELRIRSYLDSNCASCHRLGGVPMVGMDLRYSIPPNFHNTIQVSTGSLASDPSNYLVEPGRHEVSELWIRDNSLADNKMPPLSKQRLDTFYLKELAKWIDGLPDDAGVIDDIIVYPNPSNGFLIARLPEEWSENTTLELFDLNGRLVHKQGSDGQVNYLEVAHLSQGMYLLRVLDGEKQFVTKCIIAP